MIGPIIYGSFNILKFMLSICKRIYKSLKVNHSIKVTVDQEFRYFFRRLNIFTI